MAKEIVEIKELSASEVGVTEPGKGNIEFRQRVPNEVLVKIKAQAPSLTIDMLNDPAVSINFGQDVVRKVNDLSVKMLKEQEEGDIPQADAIVNDVLRALDGYNAKYKYKEPGKVSKFFKKLGAQGKETVYDLKSMVRDAKPIADRLLEAEGKIHKMELKIDENIVRSQQLRDITIESIDDVATVIAIFEEVIEVATAEIIEAEKTLSEASRKGEAIVEYRGKKYSVDEFREVLADMTSAEAEIEKTWFNWRQKFFLYIINITSTREIINTSISLKRTANRVRVDAIPAARTQLAAWQQAARMEETAKTVESANRGMEELILGASRGQLSAIEAAATANQRQMLSEKAILELTENVQKQFAAIVQAESTGREVRAKNLELLKTSETAILSASSDAQKQIISQSVAQLSGDSSHVIESENPYMNVKQLTSETTDEPIVEETPVKVESASLESFLK